MQATDLVLALASNGPPIGDGVLHALLPGGRVGDGDTVVYAVIRNESATATWSSGKLWITPDPHGGQLSVALADPAAQGLMYSWATFPTPAAYSAPASAATGISLPTLAPQTKCLIAVRRNLVGATAAYPESNRLNVSGSSSA